METFKQEVTKIMESYRTAHNQLYEKMEAVRDKWRVNKYTKQEFDSWATSLMQDSMELIGKKKAELEAARRRYEPRQSREAVSITGDQPDMKLLDLKLTQEEFDIIAERNKHNRGMVIALKAYASKHPLKYTPPLFGTAALEVVDNIIDNAGRYMYTLRDPDVEINKPFDVEQATNRFTGYVL